MGETAGNLALMRLIDAQFLETPWHGSHRMARHPRRDGHEVGRNRVRRFMALIGLVPIYQRPRTTVPNSEHRMYPYLLRDLGVDWPNQAWCTDVTEVLRAADVRISMEGRGRWRDNVCIERLWRGLKYECIYLHAFETGSELRAGLAKWMGYYNTRRPHSTLAGHTPGEACGASVTERLAA